MISPVGSEDLSGVGKMRGMKFEAVIFDLDGTLIDSVPAYYKLLEIVVERLNLPPVSKGMVSDLMKGGVNAWEILTPPEMKDRKEEFRKQIFQVSREAGRELFQKEVDLIPGVAEIFSQLSEKKIKIGLVTSTHTQFLDEKMIPLKKKGLDKLIDVLIGIEDAPKVKPAPDPLIECARRMGVARAGCIYIGDTSIDLKAGKAAGMATAGVLTGLDDHETLKREDPDIIVDSVFDLRHILV